MKSEQVEKAMKAAVILALAGIIAKILSAFYRIPFQNIVGNAGFYVYQQVYPIYGIGMTFALSGFPVYLSKLVAKKDNPLAQISLLKKIFNILLVLGLLIFAFLQLKAHTLALLMGDPGLALLIKSVAWMFLFMPFLAVPRGYYQGTLRMIPVALSQVAEQVIRVAVILVCALCFAKYHWSLYQMGAYAMLGSTFGAMGALSVMLGFYRLFTPKAKVKVESYRFLAWHLATDGIVICLFASLMVLLQLVDSFTVMKNLSYSGLKIFEAQNIKGAYDRAQPLVQLGMALALGFSSSLLPALERAKVKKQADLFLATAKTLLKISLTLAMAATVGMISIMPQLNTLLFGDCFLSQSLDVYVVSIVLMTLIGTFNAILQSLNYIKETVTALLAGIGVKILLNGPLIKMLGISGASLATVLALLAALGLIIKACPKEIRGLLDLTFSLKLSLACAMMWLAVFLADLVLNLGAGRLMFGGEGLLLALIGAVVFFVAVAYLKLFTKAEWLVLPKGEYLWQLVVKIRNEE